jgi:hypothetical protein
LQRVEEQKIENYLSKDTFGEEKQSGKKWNSLTLWCGKGKKREEEEAAKR